MVERRLSRSSCTSAAALVGAVDEVLHRTWTRSARARAPSARRCR